MQSEGLQKHEIECEKCNAALREAMKYKRLNLELQQTNEQYNQTNALLYGKLTGLEEENQSLRETILQFETEQTQKMDEYLNGIESLRNDSIDLQNPNTNEQSLDPPLSTEKRKRITVKDASDDDVLKPTRTNTIHDLVDWFETRFDPPSLPVETNTAHDMVSLDNNDHQRRSKSKLAWALDTNHDQNDDDRDRHEFKFELRQDIENELSVSYELKLQKEKNSMQEECKQITQKYEQRIDELNATLNAHGNEAHHQANIANTNAGADQTVNHLKSEDERDHFRAKPLKYEMQTITKDMPLTQFTVEDMMNTIANWVQNDMNYRRHRLQTTSIFSKHQLGGNKMVILSGDDAKRIVKEEMLKVITLNTLDIMFDGFDKLKEANVEALQPKSAEQIAQVLFEYPLGQLLTRIKTDRIDGKAFVESVAGDSVHKLNVIQQETGWKEAEIEQIHLILFRGATLRKERFQLKIQSVLQDSNGVPTAVLKRIEEITNRYDMEQLQYNIKHNKNIDEFNEQVISIICEINTVEAGNLTQNVYNAIARCFAFNYEDVGDDHELEPRDWICSNCGNYNFSKYIHGKIDHNLKWC
eukprot:1015006_1